MSDDLPSFERPPVVETVLGVQFQPIRGFSNGHLGAFWWHLGAEQWPHVTDDGVLEQTFEEFGDSETWQTVGTRVRLSQIPASRLKIQNADQDRMIQVQHNRFHYNWLRQQGKDYPRYTSVRPGFDDAYARFRAFLSVASLEPPSPNQWELTYVNHIFRGDLWAEVSEWDRVLRGLPGPWAQPEGLTLEGVGGRWHFEIPPQRGRLHVGIARARAGSAEGDELLRMDLTARGAIDPEEGERGLDEGLSLGRRTIVQAFKALTTEEAHEHWGIHHVAP